MGVSGALFDMVKMLDVSKNVISKYSAEEVYDQSYEWAKEYNVPQHHGVQDGSGSHFPCVDFQDHTHIYNKHIPYK